MASTKRSAGRRFDREHRVTTQALLFLGELGAARRPEAYAHATHYEPVPIADFRALVRRIPKAVIAESTFVDVGAGMGRAVLIAMEYPFRQIVGIELSPQLFEVARENLANASSLDVRCRDVRLVCADARRRRFPAGNLVVFLYNPFDGEAFDAVLDRIDERRNSAETWLLYHTPVHGDRALARGYETLKTESDAAVYRRSCDWMNDTISSGANAGAK